MESTSAISLAVSLRIKPITRCPASVHFEDGRILGRPPMLCECEYTCIIVCIRVRMCATAHYNIMGIEYMGIYVYTCIHRLVSGSRNTCMSVCMNIGPYCSLYEYTNIRFRYMIIYIIYINNIYI